MSSSDTRFTSTRVRQPGHHTMSRCTHVPALESAAASALRVRLCFFGGECFVCAFQRPTLTRGYDCVAVVLAQHVVVVVRWKKILAGRLQKRDFFHAQAQGDEPGDRRKAVMMPASDSMPKMIGHIPRRCLAGTDCS